jgi:hypothetical protein
MELKKEDETTVKLEVKAPSSEVPVTVGPDAKRTVEKMELKKEGDAVVGKVVEKTVEAGKAEQGANVPSSNPYTAVMNAVENVKKVTDGNPIGEKGPDMTMGRYVVKEWYSIKWKDSFHSELEYFSSPVEGPSGKHVKWRFKSRIGAFNDRWEYIEARDAFNQQMLEKYDGVFRGIEEVLVPVFGRAKVTRESQIGFSGYTFIQEREVQVYKSLVDILDTLGNEDVSDPDPLNSSNRKKVVVCCHPEERKLQNLLHEVGTRRLIEIDDLWRWFQYAGDEFHVVQQPSIYIDRRFNKAIIPGPYSAFYQFIDNNKFARAFATDLVRDLIRSHLSIDVEKRQETIIGLLKVFEIRTNVMSTIGDLGTVMNASAAEELFKNIVTCLLMGRYCKLEYVFDFTGKLNVFTLISAIILKLLIPTQLLTRETKYDVDNYIAKWLLPKIPGLNKSQYLWDEIRATQRSVNYLTANRNANVLSIGKVAAAFWDFFLTLPNGHGWGGTELNGMESFPPGSDVFIGRSEVFYAYFAGKKINDPEFEMTLQMQRFRALYKALDDQKNALEYGRWKKNEWDAVLKTLEMINDKWQLVSKMAMTIDIIQRRLAMISVLAPVRPVDDDVAAVNTYTLAVPYNAPVSLLFLGIFDSKSPISVSTLYIKWGWGVHEFFNELIEKYAYITRLYGSTQEDRYHWPKKWRITKTFSMVKSDPGLKAPLLALLQNTTNDEGIVWPALGPLTSRMEFIKKMQWVDDFVWAHRPLFGFTNKFYYSNNYAPDHPLFFRREWRQNDGTSVGNVFNYDQLSRAVQVIGFGTVLKNVRDAVVPRCIMFDIPVRIDMKEEVGAFQQPDVVSFDTKEKTKIGTLTYYYTWNWHLNLDLDNKVALAHDPNWVLDTRSLPFIDQDVDYVRKLFGYAIAYKEKFNVWDDFIVIAIG